MLAGNDIVCLSSLRWSSFPTSRHHLARILAEGNRLLFVDPPGSIGRVRPRRGSLTDEPPVLRYAPAPHLPYGGRVRSLLSTAANQRFYAGGVLRAIRDSGMSSPVVWNVFPVYSAARLVEMTASSVQFLHMTDALWDYPWYSRAYEDGLLRCLEPAAFALGSSPEIVERLSSYGKPTHLLEHGVDVDLFRPVAEGRQTPHPATRGRPRPRIGLVGSIDHRLDPDLVVALASIGSVTLVGPVATGATALDRTELARLEAAGCHFEGMADPSAVPSWLAGFDLAVLPYRDNSLVRSSNPLKLLEYLAAGLPVVAVDIPAARRYAPLVALARGTEQFLAEARSTLAEEETRPELRQARFQTAAAHSWRRRAEDLSDYLLATGAVQDAAR